MSAEDAKIEAPQAPRGWMGAGGGVPLPLGSWLCPLPINFLNF